MPIRMARIIGTTSANSTMLVPLRRPIFEDSAHLGRCGESRREPPPTVGTGWHTPALDDDSAAVETPEPSAAVPFVPATPGARARFSRPRCSSRQCTQVWSRPSRVRGDNRWHQVVRSHGARPRPGACSYVRSDLRRPDPPPLGGFRVRLLLRAHGRNRRHAAGLEASKRSRASAAAGLRGALRLRAGAGHSRRSGARAPRRRRAAAERRGLRGRGFGRGHGSHRLARR